MNHQYKVTFIFIFLCNIFVFFSTDADSPFLLLEVSGSYLNKLNLFFLAVFIIHNELIKDQVADTSIAFFFFLLQAFHSMLGS